MLALRRAGGVLVIAVLGLGWGAGGASAAKWSSSITLTHPTSTQFTGVVSSKLKACRKERLVTLYYTDPITGQTQPLSVQRTDAKGRYEVDLTQPAYPGGYRAQVSKEKIRALKAPQTCRGAQSTFFNV